MPFNLSLSSLFGEINYCRTTLQRRFPDAASRRSPADLNES
jgi:hypothetical protein